MCERSAYELNAPSHVARFAFANACATLPSLARAVTNPAENRCDWRSRGRARSVVDRACDRQLSCALQRAFASRASLQQSGQLTSVLCRGRGERCWIDSTQPESRPAQPVALARRVQPRHSRRQARANLGASLGRASTHPGSRGARQAKGAPFCTRRLARTTRTRPA